MSRPGGGAIAAALAGLVVVAAGLWAQVRALDGDETEAAAVLAASVDFFAEGPTRLVVHNLTTGERSVLAGDGGGIPGAPAWSPDGRRLAWYEIREEGRAAVVVVWERRRGVRREFEVEPEGLNRLVWSPDSALLLSAGRPLRVWDVNGRVVATGPAPDESAARSVGVPALPWSPDGESFAYGLGTRLIEYVRDSNTTHAWTAEDLGLPQSEFGYLPIGWSGNTTLVVFSQSEPRIFEADIAALSSRELDEPPREAIPPGQEVFGVARLRVPTGPATFSQTADGGGTFAAAASAEDMLAGRATLFLEVAGAFYEFQIETADPTFRNMSVVLVGDWPSP